MTACTSALNLLFQPFFHITCLVHLAHNFCEKVRNHYTRVNTLISSIKASTIKNTTHRELFTTVGYPPEPVITRWGTWLEASQYYWKNFEEIKTIIIINNYTDTGHLEKAPVSAVSAKGVREDLSNISSYYNCILGTMTNLLKTTYQLQTVLK